MKSLNTKNGSSNVSSQLESAMSQPEQNTPVMTPWGMQFSGAASRARMAADSLNNGASRTGAAEYLSARSKRDSAARRLVSAEEVLSAETLPGFRAELFEILNPEARAAYVAALAKISNR